MRSKGAKEEKEPFELKCETVCTNTLCRFEYFSYVKIRVFTVVFGCNYQKKNDQRKISSESVALLVRRSEKPWFSQI